MKTQKIILGATALVGLAAGTQVPHNQLHAQYQQHLYTIHMDGTNIVKTNPYYTHGHSVTIHQPTQRTAPVHHVVQQSHRNSHPVVHHTTPKHTTTPIRRTTHPTVAHHAAPQPRRVVNHGVSNSTKNTYRNWLKSDNMILINKSHGVGSNFVPKNLQHVRNGFYLKSEALKAFREMEAAYHRQYGINFEIVSTYRSYWTQYSTHQHWVNVYGNSYANKVSAVAGHSEHQSGLALDIQNIGHSVLDESFENTQTFRWLQQNAYKYGFILRFPKGKTNITGYNYEPWHYRFIGKDQAKLFHSKGNGYTYEQFIDFLKSQSR